MSNEFDVIFHFGDLHAWLGQNWKSYFTHPTEEITLPKGASKSFSVYADAIRSKWGDRPIYNALTQRGWARKGVRIGVMGFSETCIGAAVLLASADGGVIDFAFACDGIHANEHIWYNFGKKAAYGEVTNPNCPPTERCLVITHSQTASPGKDKQGNPIPTTTQTADTIAKAVMANPVPTRFVPIPELKDAPHEPISCRCSYSNEVVQYTRIPGWYNTNVGNFYVFGYNNIGKTCTDHIYQSKVIAPRVLQHILIPRWNNNPRPSGECVVA